MDDDLIMDCLGAIFAATGFASKDQLVWPSSMPPRTADCSACARNSRPGWGSLLIVDDVLDTVHTVRAIVDEIHGKLRLNTPADIRVAVPYYKPTRNQTDLVPDYSAPNLIIYSGSPRQYSP